MSETLYHFTCRDGFKHIGRYNCLIIPNSAPHPADWPPLSWFTTEPRPDRQATGLGSVSTKCDRMSHRYVITDLSHCTPWLTCPWRSATPKPFLKVLEEFGDVGHWWVSDRIVRAEWDRAWRAPDPLAPSGP